MMQQSGNEADFHEPTPSIKPIDCPGFRTILGDDQANFPRIHFFLPIE
jgi:hypothetical protein